MKRLGILLLALILTLSLAACETGKKTEEVPAPEISTETPVKEEDPVLIDLPQAELPEASTEIAQTSDPLQVPGAANYRGVVTYLNQGEVKGFILEQYEGTDYGKKQITVNLDESSRPNFNIDLLTEGYYLEVYYGRDLNATETPDEVTAIAINFLGKPEERIFNGIVTLVSPSAEDPLKGSLLVTDLNGDNETVFNYEQNGSTQFHLNFEKIVPGVKLNILHQPIMTMSMPPQIFAEEVNFYAEPIEG